MNVARAIAILTICSPAFAGDITPQASTPSVSPEVCDLRAIEFAHVMDRAEKYNCTVADNFIAQKFERIREACEKIDGWAQHRDSIAAGIERVLDEKLKRMSKRDVCQLAAASKHIFIAGDSVIEIKGVCDKGLIKVAGWLGRARRVCDGLDSAYDSAKAGAEKCTALMSDHDRTQAFVKGWGEAELFLRKNQKQACKQANSLALSVASGKAFYMTTFAQER